MSPEDRRKFDSWLKANAVLGLILFLGMLAMAFAATTTSPKSSYVAAGTSSQLAKAAAVRESSSVPGRR